MSQLGYEPYDLTVSAPFCPNHYHHQLGYSMASDCTGSLGLLILNVHVIAIFTKAYYAERSEAFQDTSESFADHSVENKIIYRVAHKKRAEFRGLSSCISNR